MTRARLAIVLLAVFAGAALLSLVWTPYDPGAVAVAERLRPPSFAHPFGTDQLGRDVLSLVMAGARASLFVIVAAVAVGLTGGLPLGLLAAARGGVVDEAVMRAADLAFALPALLVALLLAAAIGPGAASAALAIGLYAIPVLARVTRSVARILYRGDMVAAARVAGAGPARIAFAHVLPNCAGAILTQATVQAALALIAEAGLSAVGLGVQPPEASWGRMLAEAQTWGAEAPWLALAPGLAITLTVLGLTLGGDAVARRWGAA
ncbi:MAG: ABC transporter permease [Sphingomonas fennica]